MTITLASITHNPRPADMLRPLFHLFLVYRSFALPILVVSAIVAPCWLLYRLYRLRKPGHVLSLSREIVLLAFVLYLSGLAATTLTPNRSSRVIAEGAAGIDLRPDLASLTCSTASLPTGSRERSFCVRNARGNVLLFFPLGILIPLVWSRLRFWRGTQIAAALSIGIELVQYFSGAWGGYRAADVNDVILNVSGACLGLGVVFVLRLLRGPRPALAGA